MKGLERAFGMRNIDINKAHVLIMEMPLAVVQRMSWVKKVLSELFTMAVICKWKGLMFCLATTATTVGTWGRVLLRCSVDAQRLNNVR